MTRIIRGTTPRLVLFQTFSDSEDHRLMCVDIELSSPVHSWIRVSRGVPQWARQSSDFALETQGTDEFFFFGGTTVTHAKLHRYCSLPNCPNRFCFAFRREYVLTDLGTMTLSAHRSLLKDRSSVRPGGQRLISSSLGTTWWR